MTIARLPALPLVAMLAACATTAPQDEPAPVEERLADFSGDCDAEAAREFVGRKASGESGAAILRATGAATLRWGPPNSVFSMDYRTDRVNVMYDAAMTITEVRCG